MNRNEFFEYIVSAIEPYLTGLGFVFKKSKDGFIKLNEDGWIKVALSFYKFAGVYNLNIGFELRRNSIQDIYVKYIDMNPTGHKSSLTFGLYLTQFWNQKSPNAFDFLTTDEFDILFKEKIVPFLIDSVPVLSEKYNNLKNIYSLFTDPTDPNNKYIFPSYDNYIAALVTGWLVYPDNFDMVVKRCKELFLQIRNKYPDHYDIELYDRDFDKIVADLKHANGNSNLIGNYWTIEKIKDNQ